MCDRRTDPTGLQTSLQTRSSLLFSSLNMILKLENFFSSFNLTALLIMWSLFKKYCSSFLHQKPCKFIYAVWLYLKNSCFEKRYISKLAQNFGTLYKDATSLKSFKENIKKISVNRISVNRPADYAERNSMCRIHLTKSFCNWSKFYLLCDSGVDMVATFRCVINLPTHFRDVFRTLSNISDVALWERR